MSSQAAPAPPLSGRGAAITVVAQAVARGITLFVVLGSTAIVTRALGVDVFADWVTALSLMAMAGFILDPGITPVIVRRLIQDPHQAPRPRTLLLVRLALGTLGAILVAALTTILRGPDALLLGAVLGSQLIPRAAVMNVGAFLQADQRLHRQTALEAGVAALGLGGLAIAAANDASPEALGAIGFLVPSLLLAALMSDQLRRSPSAALPPHDAPQNPRIRSVALEVAPLAASLVFVTLYARVDVLFVNAAVGAAEVAAYLFSFQFIEQLFVLGAIVGSAVLPLMAVRAKVIDPFKDTLTHHMLVSLAAAGALGSFALIALAEPLTRLIGGPGLARAAEPLMLLAPTTVVLLVAIPLGTIYLAKGEGRRYLVFNSLALVFNLVANAALTLPFGIDWAARITWATELTVAITASIPLWRAHRTTAIELAGLIAIAIGASEIAVHAADPYLVAGTAGVAVLALTGRRLLWMLRLLRRPELAEEPPRDDLSPPRP
jgi:O-antigen/teichoic acid export membrane protein